MALAAALFAALIAGAVPVAGIGPAAVRPVILRGGVLVLPLNATQPGDRWPSTVSLRFEDGESVDAAVAWVHAAPAPTARRWTDDPSELAVRAIASTDDTANPPDGGAPYAVVALSMGRGGDFTVIDPRGAAPAPASAPPPTPVRPIWIETAMIASLAARPDAPVLERSESTALPDPSSPFDFWRWTLLAQRREMQAPPPGEGLAGLVARHGAEMWTIGLARLAAQSPGVAAACREALTQTSVDGDRTLASWVTEAVETGALLSLLLDFNRRDRAVMDAALGWTDSRSPLVLWIEQEQGGLVTIAAANGSPSPVEAVASWTSWTTAENGLAPLQGVQPAIAPLRRMVRAGELARLHVARPSHLPGPALARPDARESPLALTIEAGGHRRDVTVGPAVAGAEPPGLPLDVFRPPLRLGEARSGVQRAVNASRATGGLLRRTRGRWELFIECARPSRVEPLDIGDDKGNVDGVAEGVLPIGREAVVVAIGPRDAPTVVLVVGEEGEPRVVEGEAAREARVGLRTAERLRRAASSTAGGASAPVDTAGELAGPAAPLRDDLEIVRRSLPTLWRCRIVLPDAWLPSGEGETLLLGVARTHGGDGAIETAGLPQVPWDLWPSPVAVDLGRWDE